VRDRRRSALAALVAAACATLAVCAAVAPVGQTEAAWVDREIATAKLTVKTLPAIPNFACPADGASFTWTTPAAPFPGAVLSGYEFSYVQLQTSNPATVVSLPATATSTSIPANALVLLASYRVTLTAKYGNWVTPPATRTLNVVLELAGVKVYTCGA